MIKRFDDLLDTMSKWGIVFCIIFMLIFTLVNIALRWFGISIHWSEPFVRHLVFIGAFLGGSLATGSNHHIKIDILPRILEAKNLHLYLPLVEFITKLGTLVATITICYASFNLAELEFDFGKEAFLNIHSGYLLSIIPAGMFLISLRVFNKCILSLIFILKNSKKNKAAI